MLSQWKVNWGPILILCGCDGETVVAAVAVVAIIISSSHYVNNSSIFRSKAMHLEHHKTNTYLPIHCLWFHTHIHTFVWLLLFICFWIYRRYFSYFLLKFAYIVKKRASEINWEKNGPFQLLDTCVCIIMDRSIAICRLCVEYVSYHNNLMMVQSFDILSKRKKKSQK